MVGEVFRLNVSFFLGGGAEECSVHEFLSLVASSII